jgi:hypothetical protein
MHSVEKIIEKETNIHQEKQIYIKEMRNKK